MLHHASRLTTASLPLSFILQAAASRAWIRTRAAQDAGTATSAVIMRQPFEAGRQLENPHHDVSAEPS